MATLEEILAQVGLSEAPSQTKTASAAAPSSKEVNKVLEDLGLSGVEDIDNAGVTKTASEGRNHMGFTDIYDSMFGEVAPAATEETQVKTAAADAVATAEAGAEEVTESSTAMGELTGIYFNVLEDSFYEKLAGDLEMEAGKGHKSVDNAGGELSRIVGKEGDPRIAVNHDPASGAGLKVNPGNQTPYSLKAKAQIKAILKRNMKSEPGDIGGYNE
jgi:hypothetical protein